MERREFLARCAAFAGSVPFFAFLQGCAKSTGGLYDSFEVNFSGKVLVIGAGAAGLAAGYILDRYGIDFEILEAGPEIGGRTKRLDGFADFPIDLGAEWIHTDPSILAELIDDTSVDASIEVVPYSPETYKVYSNGTLKDRNFFSAFYGEHKFKRTTWFGFLETYIAAGILDRVRLNTPVVDIDYSGETIIVTEQKGQQFEADRVLVTVPLKILQLGIVGFTPELPASKQRAIESVYVPPGLKAFFRFEERFYPDMTMVGSVLEDGSNRLFFDGAFRKDSEHNVLSFFFVSENASELTDLGSDEAIAEALIAQLDEIFDGQASANLIDVVVKNWSADPWVQGAYSYDWPDGYGSTIEALAAPVNKQLYFAGEATSYDNVSTVHGAMQSGYDAVEALLKG